MDKIGAYSIKFHVSIAPQKAKNRAKDAAKTENLVNSTKKQK